MLHDALGWWDGIRSRSGWTRCSPWRAAIRSAAAARARSGDVPYGCDPWLATRRAAPRVAATRLWRWPFAPGADYLVCALVTRRTG